MAPPQVAWCQQPRTRAHAADTPDEVKRARSLTDPERVRIVIQYTVVAKERRTASAKRVPRLRIKCLDARGKVLVRDTHRDALGAVVLPRTTDSSDAVVGDTLRVRWNSR